MLERSIGGAPPQQIVIQLGDGDVTENDVITHIRHIRKSLRNSEKTLEAKPPECRGCGYNNFDDVLNRPSRCPDCKSEWIQDPKFRIE